MGGRLPNNKQRTKNYFSRRTRDGPSERRTQGAAVSLKQAGGEAAGEVNSLVRQAGV